LIPLTLPVELTVAMAFLLDFQVTFLLLEFEGLIAGMRMKVFPLIIETDFLFNETFNTKILGGVAVGVGVGVGVAEALARDSCTLKKDEIINELTISMPISFLYTNSPTFYASNIIIILQMK